MRDGDGRRLYIMYIPPCFVVLLGTMPRIHFKDFKAPANTTLLPAGAKWH
jgi:hypothetical protein